MSDSDESMEDAPETTSVNTKKNAEVSPSQGASNSSSEFESSDESSSEIQTTYVSHSARQVDFFTNSLLLSIANFRKRRDSYRPPVSGHPQRSLDLQQLYHPPFRTSRVNKFSILQHRHIYPYQKSNKLHSERRHRENQFCHIKVWITVSWKPPGNRSRAPRRC